MNRTAVFAGATALFGDVVLLNVLFITFSYLQTGRLMQMGFPAWASCVLLIYLGNIVLLRRPRALPVLAGVNVFAFGVMTAVVFLFFAQMSGVWAVCFAVFFLLITAGRACSLALHPITVSHMLSCFTVLLIEVFFYTLVQGGGGVPNAYDLVLLAALLAEIAAMAMLRMFGDGRNVFCGSKWQGIALLAGSFAAFGLLLFVFFTLLSENARSAASLFAGYAAAAGKAVLRGVLWLMSALVSLIPVRDTEEYVPPPAQAADGYRAAEEIESIVFDPTVLIVLGCVAAGLLLGLVLFFLFRFRRVKIATSHTGGIAARISPPGLLTGLKRWYSAKLAAVRFCLQSLYHRNTPPGVLVRLERWARRRRMARQTGETHGAFLHRMGEAPPLREGEIPALLNRLKRELDVMYYAGPEARAAEDLSPRDLRRIRAVLRGTRRRRESER